ncbi:PDZ domain-containing protein, partial [Acinetobacter variabilis]|uniref:S1C family serine protease n=1 Tax=Acinetobacter variabilis TaxID=70346 RepID=UPI0028A88C24
RGWLGISLLPTERNDVLQPKESGVVVAEVLENGPAAKAGIQRGDRIIKVNNEVITSASHLINFVALQAPNSTVQIEVERAGKTMTLDVVISERKTQSSSSQYIPLPGQ